jgi:hypothetical protein
MQNPGENKRKDLKMMEGTGMMDIIRSKWKQFWTWMKPDPKDPLGITILKSIYKLIALLLLVAFSPVILVVLIFVFLAAI